ncbi:MAG: hypothetical protein QOI86_4908 [Actinomycetota bacterium]|nr:hypothetical protein [Actinomycetota bacterium]
MIASRPLAAAALAVVLAAGLGACGGGGKGKNTKVTIDTSGPGQRTEGATVSLKAALKGSDEVPGPGVVTGVGAFVIDIAGTKGCYDLKATMGEKPTKAHIHKGAAGVGGPVVVDLMPAFQPGESAFTAKACVDLPGDTAAKLIAEPSAYYVNVHSEGHPDGAIRGQLAKF